MINPVRHVAKDSWVKSVGFKYTNTHIDTLFVFYVALRLYRIDPAFSKGSNSHTGDATRVVPL